MYTSIVKSRAEKKTQKILLNKFWKSATHFVNYIHAYTAQYEVSLHETNRLLKHMEAAN